MLRFFMDLGVFCECSVFDIQMQSESQLNPNSSVESLLLLIDGCFEGVFPIEHCA